MRMRLPLVVVLAASLVPARAEWIPAMAPNGSFERDANRDGRPDEWETATFKSLARAEWDRTVALGDVTVGCHTPFASVSLVSLDGEPVETSRRLLLTAVARSENTGQATTDKHGAIPERGRTPVLAEPVDCCVTIRTRQPLQAWPLNARAEKGDAAQVKLVSATGVPQVETTGAESPWVLLAAE